MPIKRVQHGRIEQPEDKPKKAEKPAPAAKPTPAAKSNSYSAKDITVLEGLEAVRKRPGMYIGTTGVAGLHHLVWEVVDNSVDEAMAGFCNTIIVTLLPDHMLSVHDNGRGIPVDVHPTQKISALEVIMTVLHAGGKFGNEGYKVSGGLHGVGASVVNALSSYVRAEVHRDGKIWVQEYKNGGHPVKKVTAIGNCKDTGTIITFRPDETIFETINFDWQTIVDRLRQTAYLSKGLKIIIKDQRPDEERAVDNSALPAPHDTYQYFFEGGIASYVQYLNHNKQRKHEQVFYVEKDAEDVHVEIALQYSDEFTESLFAFTNNIFNPDGGTHVQGFRTALTRSLNNYARNKNILKEKDDNLTGEDVREGLNAIISVKIREPQFEGQTKGKLGNTEAKTAVETIMNDAFLVFLEEHPRDAEAIVGKCILASKARNAAKIARDTILRKGALEGFTLPGKLADCSSRHAEQSELFIVEGDSAGGCFSANVSVILADGRSVTFENLVREDMDGKQNFCYTIKDDGNIGIEKIINPRITKRDAEVIKIVLDNNEEIICTPDHKFMLRNGVYKMAKDLTNADSLMPLYTKLSVKGNGITIEGYEMTFNPIKNKWIFTHLLADDYNLRNNIYSVNDGSNKHHIDFNKLNNNPTNIKRMTQQGHFEYHRNMLQYGLHRPDIKEKSRKAHKTVEYREKARQKSLEKRELFSRNAKAQWSDPAYKKFMTEKFLEFYHSNEQYRQTNNEQLNLAQTKYWDASENRTQQARRVAEFFQQHPERKEWLKDIADKQWKNIDLKNWRRQKTSEQWTSEFRDQRKRAYNATYLRHSLSFAKSLAEKGIDFVRRYNIERANLPKRNNNIVKFETLLSRFFGNDRARLTEAVQNFNHKVVRVEKLNYRTDVYDIEVPGTHNFALASGIFVHNSAKQGRDREHQAILPLRGKVLNVERARLDKILTNNELKSLIIALGTNIGEQFDISKLRYHHIVIMTDADVDGAHIRTLLLTFFYRYFPALITEGHVYIAQPPLYSLKFGKEMKYAYNDEEKETILAELNKGKKAEADKKSKKAESEVVNETNADGDELAPVESIVVGGVKVNIQRYKGLGEMNPDQLWDTTMDPTKRLMKKVSVSDAEAANLTFEILMGDDVAERKKFIQTHAKSVRNIDV